MLSKITLLTLAPLALFAQSGLTFSYEISGAGGSSALKPADRIVYPAIVSGSASLVTIYCVNQSQSSYTVAAGVNNPSFSISMPSVQLAPGSSTAIGVTFLPKSAGAAAATLALTLNDSSGLPQVVQFALTAQAVEGVLASVASEGNQVLLPDGATFAFPPTVPGSHSDVQFTISNRTSATVTVDSVLLSGLGFRMSGLPLMPLSINTGGQVSVSITFAPDQAKSFGGTLSYSVSGAPHRVLFSGIGAAASLEFEMVSGSVQAIQSGATIAFPPMAVGTPSTLTLRVRNTGTAPALIPILDASPSSFQLQNAPGAPLSIAAGDSATLVLAFVPQAAGNISGVLHIGAASFVLSGVGSGAQFSCIVTTRTETLGVCGATFITLPSTSLGDQLRFAIQITNTGNQTGTIKDFALGGNGFSADTVRSLPVSLAPGESVSFDALFAPAVLGITGGYLQVNTMTSNLTVAATAPPSLPVISFTNASAILQTSAQPLTQPSVGIHLASPYAYALAGRLLLNFNSESLIDDPAVQFLNGQRYVDFRIPAGATEAIFGTTATSIVMQTGTTAGVITLSASVTLGSYVVTGSSPVTQNVSVSSAAPQIRSLQIGAMDNSGFDLQITGLSTTRSVGQLTFSLTAPNGTANSGSLATTTLTADVSSAFKDWFNSAPSRSYGGQFSMTVHFNVSGDVAAIQTITATASNEKGSSDSKSVNLQSSNP